MAIWMSRIGWIGIVVGILLCSPLAELLPVDLWVQLKELFSGRKVGAPHVYFQVNPGPAASMDPVKLVGAAFIVAGLLLLGMGYWIRSGR